MEHLNASKLFNCDAGTGFCTQERSCSDDTIQTITRVNSKNTTVIIVLTILLCLSPVEELVNHLDGGSGCIYTRVVRLTPKKINDGLSGRGSNLQQDEWGGYRDRWVAYRILSDEAIESMDESAPFVVVVIIEGALHVLERRTIIDFGLSVSGITRMLYKEDSRMADEVNTYSHGSIKCGPAEPRLSKKAYIGISQNPGIFS